MNITISFPDAVIKDNLIWKSHPPGKNYLYLQSLILWPTGCIHQHSDFKHDVITIALLMTLMAMKPPYHSRHCQQCTHTITISPVTIFTNAALSQVRIKTVFNLVPGCCRAKKLALRDIFTFCNCCCFPWMCTWTILAISCKCAHFTWESKSIQCFVSVLIWLWEDCCGCGVNISYVYILF